MHHLLSIDLELAQMIKAQGQDIFLHHRQSLCQVINSNHFPLQNMALTGIMHFWGGNDLEFAQMTMGHKSKS